MLNAAMLSADEEPEATGAEFSCTMVGTVGGMVGAAVGAAPSAEAPSMEAPFTEAPFAGGSEVGDAVMNVTDGVVAVTLAAATVLRVAVSTPAAVACCTMALTMVGLSPDAELVIAAAAVEAADAWLPSSVTV